MSPLIKAILGEDIQTVRRLCQTNPELLTVPSEAGTLPLRLAKDKGKADLQVALLRANASGTEAIKDYSALLIDYIRELSHEHACSGWLDEIEFILWQVVSTGEPLGADPFRFAKMDEQVRADLRFLSRRAGGWAMYTDGGPQFVAMEQWQDIFEGWRRKCV